MKFETHALTGNIATAGDTFSLLRLVSAGLGIGFAPEWRKDLPNRNFKLRSVRSVDLKTGLGVAWNKRTQRRRETTFIDIARSLARPGR